LYVNIFIFITNITGQEAQLSQRPCDASCHWIFR